MKFLCRALCVLLIANCALRAQEDDSLGDFAPLDDDLVLYIPKFAVKLGFRGIGGVKTAFGGKGQLSSISLLGREPGETPDNRLYHDGYVALDTRTIVDPAGNSVPITPDGRTNTWSFKDDRQVTANGLVQMHSYTATTTDTSFHEKDPASGFGLELSLDREVGNVFGTRLKWGVVGGLSINQVSSATTAELAGAIETTTDSYSLLGQAAPTAPFTGPVSTNSIFDTPLLGNELLSRVVTTISQPGAIISSWKLRGAYMSFRVGASLFVPITERFSAMFSAGPVLVYAGTTFDVNHSFRPNTGDTISEFISDGESAILPGYYADATVQLALNDTAGLYLGAVYQSSGDYTQDITSPDGNTKYSTRVDLSSLQGVRAGVSFKF